LWAGLGTRRLDGSLALCFFKADYMRGKTDAKLMDN
jgi:uncharacterized protein (DUF779 family)